MDPLDLRVKSDDPVKPLQTSKPEPPVEPASTDVKQNVEAVKPEPPVEPPSTELEVGIDEAQQSNVPSHNASLPPATPEKTMEEVHQVKLVVEESFTPSASASHSTGKNPPPFSINFASRIDVFHSLFYNVYKNDLCCFVPTSDTKTSTPSNDDSRVVS